MIWKTTDDVLDYAIAAEQAAITGYTKMAGEAKVEKTRALLLRIASEEVSHKRKLISLKESRSFSRAALDLAAMEQDMNPRSEVVASMTQKEALAFALQNEKDAAFLYSSLAEMVEDADQSNLFTMIADDESTHAQELKRIMRG